MVGFLQRRGLFGGIGPQTLLGLAAGIGSGDTLGEGLGRGFALAGRGLELDRKQAQDTRRRELLSELTSDTSGTFGSLSPQVRALAAEDPSLARSLIVADATSKAKKAAQGGFSLVTGPGGETFQRGPQGRLFALPRTLDQEKELRSAGASRVNVTTGGAKKLSEATAQKFVEAQEAAAGATRNISNLTVLENALSNPDVFTGTGGNAINAVKRFGSTFLGLDLSGVADAEVAQRVSREIALSLKKNLPGPLSDSDRKFLLSLPAGLSKSPEGNRRLIAIAKLQAQRDVARAGIFRDHLREDGSVDPQVFTALAKADRDLAAGISAQVRALRNVARQLPTRSPLAGVPIGTMSLKQLNTLDPSKMTENELQQAIQRRQELTGGR